ncbi:MAG: stage III sporulation protein AE [Firmicutes bacterium HGW-Firmicutes-15]|nr:MAG: stage III sporulation protein AE [Firmicutes bacterium HGW-Firmicutes-15]
MKKMSIAIILIIGFMLFPVSAEAAPADDSEAVFSVQDTLKNLDIQSLEDFKGRIDEEMNPFMQSKPLKEWLGDFMTGKWEFDFKKVMENTVRFLFKEVIANSSLLSKLIILSVLAALLVNLQTSFASDVGKISYMVCFLALCALALGSFKIVLDIGHQTIDNMVAFMVSMLPPMMVLVAGLGNVNASVMLFPILMTTATAFANAIKLIVFPLIIMSALLSLVNNISETVKVQRMAKFCSQVAQISLGFFLTTFVGVLTLRALYASVLDKVALRTARFVTDNAIPIVGKMVGDTVEVAAGYVVMLKDALGIFGVLLIAGIVFFPLLKIAALALIYKLVAAVVEPMGDSKTAAVLESMSAHLMMLLAATASVGFMFFIMIAIMAGMSNNLTMLR